MKYVIFESHGLVHAVIFGNQTSHKSVTIKDGIPVSAGFVTLNKIGWPNVYGESESLNLRNRGELDEDIIRRSLASDTPTYLFMIDYNQPENNSLK